jgi:hypothetical protein
MKQGFSNFLKKVQKLFFKELLFLQTFSNFNI